MTQLKAGTEPLAAAYGLALLDLDGVVYLLHEPIPEAPATVSALPSLDCAPVFVTNNASRSPETVAAALREMGIPANADEVLTSAQVVAAGIVAHAGRGASVLSTGSQALRDTIEAAGLRVVDDPVGADVVAFGLMPDITWRDLAAVTLAVRNGAYWAVPNMDATLPTPDGPMPGMGAMAGAVATALGRGPDLVAGKPQQPIFEAALARRPGAAAIMVGDRPDSDIEGARRAGIDSLLVFTGVVSPREALVLPPERRPDYIGWSLAALTEPHPVPVRVAEREIECGGWTAVVGSDGLVLSGDGEELDAWRALCELSWSALDAGLLDDGTTPVPTADGAAAAKVLA